MSFRWWKASKLIKEYGFTLGHQIMLGLPGDSLEKDLYTAERSIAMEPHICRIYPALVIKNTPMEKMLQEGIYEPYTLDFAVEVSKKLYVMYNSANITVIRIGLQPTEDINIGKEFICGPFHPAFRELVEGSLYNDCITRVVSKNYTGETVIEINYKEISKLYADKKKFFNDTKKQLPTTKFKVITTENLNRGEILVKTTENSEKMSIFENNMLKA